MHKITVLALLAIVFGLSTVVVLRDTFSAKKIDNANSEKTITSGVPEKTHVPDTIIKNTKQNTASPSNKNISTSVVVEKSKEILSERITTSSNEGYLSYKNSDFGVELYIPETVANITDYSHKKIGESVLQFEEIKAAPGFFEVFIRKGDVFKKNQKATDDDIVYYNWDLFYEEFQKKVVIKSQALRKSEKIIKMYGLTFLTGYYFNPELDSFVRFYRTYKNDLEVTLNYYLTVDWYGQNFSYIDNTSKVSQELMEGLMPTNTKNSIDFFEKIVSTLAIK